MRRVAGFAATLSWISGSSTARGQSPPKPQLLSNGLSGYISMSVPAPPDEYCYGVSLYATAWQLLERPLADFQIGLASIWIVPENRSVQYSLLPTGTVARDNWPERGPSYRDVFQTIEGGLGFWASTHFGSATAKFRMNGTPDGYNHEISSPGWGFGQTAALPGDQMGIAQLSPYLLVPPDGITFRNGTWGELFGYAWMALPLTRAKSASAVSPTPTGNQWWTLFINSRNFKGPVAFYTPDCWTRIARRYAPAAGRGLDARPGLVTGGAIEVNTVPRLVADDPQGRHYARVPLLQFPVDAQGRTILIHNLTHYSKDALYRAVASWLAGGPAAAGKFNVAGALVPKCKAEPLSLHHNGHPIRGWEDRVETRALGPSTFGLQWKRSGLSPDRRGAIRGTLPEYFHDDGNEAQALEPAAVPTETGLQEARFMAAAEDESYTSPDGPESVWKSPGPRAGPFKARLSDGSVLTYWWYRFIDQPALQRAGLSPVERSQLQAVAEKLQAHWTPGKEYMPPPGMGRLASLDHALIVKPPRGLEIGYVPIVTRQSPGPRLRSARW